MATFEIYKRNQGKYTRLGTFIGAMLLVVIGAYILSQKLYGLSVFLQYGIPTLIVLGMAAFMGWIINRPSNADFLIATEGEMKKVSWSSRREIAGSTKVVIVTTIMLALILLGVDLIFIRMFSWMGIMG